VQAGKAVSVAQIMVRYAHFTIIGSTPTAPLLQALCKRRSALIIEHIEIIDWYDGVIESICFLNGDEYPYYCSIIAWDVDANRRVHAYIKISGDVSELLDLLNKEPSEENWKNVRAIVSKLIESFRGNAQIRECEIDIKTSTYKGEASIESIRDQLCKGVEFATEQSQVQKWLCA